MKSAYSIIVKKVLTAVLLIVFLLCLSPATTFAACQSPGTGGAPGQAGGCGANGTSGNPGQAGGGGGSAAGGVGGNGAGGGVLLTTSSGTVSISGTVNALGGNSSATNGGTVKIINTSGCTSTSGVSAGRVYQPVGAANCPPSAPTLAYPVSSSSGNSVYTIFKLRSSDGEGDYLEYWIDVCSDAGCGTIVKSICQYSAGSNVPGTCVASQTGWAGEDSQGGTAYGGNADLTLSTLATLNYQPPLLSPNTEYWWRAFAIDPGGSNTWSGSSPIQSFTTAPTELHIQGGTHFQGNVNISGFARL